MGLVNTNTDEITEEIKALTPGVSEWDLAALIAARLEKGKKFDSADFGHYNVAHRVAQIYAINYTGTFGHMLDMKDRAKKGRFREYHTAGVINCWYNDVRTLQISGENRRGTARLASLQAAARDEGPAAGPAVSAVVPDGFYAFTFTSGATAGVRIQVKIDDPTVQICCVRGNGDPPRFHRFGFLKGSRYTRFSAYRRGYDRWHFMISKLLEFTEEECRASKELYFDKFGGM